MTYKEKVKTIRNVLTQLIRAEKMDNDTNESISDEQLQIIKELNRENILEAVKEAVGNDKKRKEVVVYVYSELSDVPGISEVFLNILKESDSKSRSWIIQTIGHKKIIDLIPVLNAHFYKETDEFCLDMLLWTLGTIAEESSYPIFYELAKTKYKKYSWRINWAFANYKKKEIIPLLKRQFKRWRISKGEKIIVAQALVKNGVTKYFNYLVKMLDDPIIKTSKSYDPGESLRAAQAISNILDWEFVWHVDSVKKVKEKLKTQIIDFSKKEVISGY